MDRAGVKDYPGNELLPPPGVVYIERQRGEGMSRRQSSLGWTLKTDFLPRHGRNYRDLYRYVFRMTGSREVSEDLVQESFCRLFGRNSNVPKADERKWLFVVARNLCYSFLDRAKKHPETDLDPDLADASGAPTPDALAADNEQRLAIEKTVLELPPALRETLILREFEDTSYAEISELQGCPIGTVRSRLAAARKILREKLRPVMEEVR